MPLIATLSVFVKKGVSKKGVSETRIPQYRTQIGLRLVLRPRAEDFGFRVGVYDVRAGV